MEIKEKEKKTEKLLFHRTSLPVGFVRLPRKRGGDTKVHGLTSIKPLTLEPERQIFIAVTLKTELMMTTEGITRDDNNHRHHASARTSAATRSAKAQGERRQTRSRILP